jgi:hypothetical protein
MSGERQVDSKKLLFGAAIAGAVGLLGGALYLLYVEAFGNFHPKIPLFATSFPCSLSLIILTSSHIYYVFV